MTRLLPHNSGGAGLYVEIWPEFRLDPPWASLWLRGDVDFDDEDEDRRTA